MTNPLDEITKIIQGLTVREDSEPLLHVTRTDIKSLLASARQEGKREVLECLAVDTEKKERYMSESSYQFMLDQLKAEGEKNE